MNICSGSAPEGYSRKQQRIKKTEVKKEVTLDGGPLLNGFFANLAGGYWSNAVGFNREIGKLLTGFSTDVGF
jgi:hypothetical protein